MKLNMRFDNLIINFRILYRFRDCVERMKQKYFPNSTHRIEFFPVEWRSSLKLDGGMIQK